MSCYDDNIGLLHALGLTGQGVAIGHLDTWVDGGHPSFNQNALCLRHFSYRGIHQQAGLGTGSRWHGTHTASLLVGQSVHSRPVGIAPGAYLYSGAVIEEGNVIARILAGLDWLLTTNASVVNLSLGIFVETPVFQTLIQAMVAKDVLIISSVGNRGAGQASVPGRYPEVLSVGATDNSGVVMPFSGSANDPLGICLKPDLVAPGVDVVGAHPGSTFEARTGTSSASARVAGLGVLLRGAFPQATAKMIKTALVATCSSPLEGQDHRSVNGAIHPIRAYEWLVSRQPLISPDEWHGTDTSQSSGSKAIAQYIDPRLQQLIDIKSKSDRCEAIFEFESWHAIDQLKATFETCTGCAPSPNEITVLTQAPIAICKLPQPLVAEVLTWRSLRVANACDVDRLNYSIPYFQ